MDGDAEVLYGRAAGSGGRVASQSLSTPDPAGTEESPPGRYVFSVEIDDGLETDAVPVELGVQLLAPGEAPGLTRSSGQVGQAATPTATPGRSPVATPAPEPAEGGANALVIVAAALGGLAVGPAASPVLTRREAA